MSGVEGISATLSFTLAQAGMSTAGSIFLGVLVAFWVSPLVSSSTRMGRWAEALLSVPFGVPSVLAAFSWILILGKNSALSRLFPLENWIYSFRSVILAHLFLNIPWVALWVSKTLAQIPANEVEASKSLGANWAQQFRWVYFPYIKWILLSLSSQVFVFCVMSFSIVLILGGGPPNQSIETAIYSRLRFGQSEGVWGLLFLQAAICLLPWLLISAGDRALLKRNSGFPVIEGGEESSQRIGKFRKASGIALCVFWVLPYGLGVIHPEAFRGLVSIWGDSELLILVMGALKRSLSVAVGVGFMSVVGVATCILVRNFLKRKSAFLSGLWTAVLWVPLGFSAVGLSFLFQSSAILSQVGEVFPAVAVIAIQSVVFLPIGFRILNPVAQQTPKHLYDASLTLGASALLTFCWVDRFRWWPHVRGVWSMAFVFSLGELAVSSLFLKGDQMPLPVLMGRFLSQYRFEESAAVALILIGMVGFAVAIAPRRVNSIV